MIEFWLAQCITYCVINRREVGSSGRRFNRNIIDEKSKCKYYISQLSSLLLVYCLFFPACTDRHIFLSHILSLVVLCHYLMMFGVLRSVVSCIFLGFLLLHISSLNPQHLFYRTTISISITCPYQCSLAHCVRFLLYLIFLSSCNVIFAYN